MKRKWILPTSVIWCLFLIAFSTHADDVFFDPQLLTHAGKSYAGLQDADYLTYDSALREYMAKRIHQQFSITLDPKTYSGFDLLEIEALLKCKKSDEPVEPFLKMFPKQR